MNVLAINTGSSSVKFSLFDRQLKTALREGEISWSHGNRQRACLSVWSDQGVEAPAWVDAHDDLTAARRAIETALAGGIAPATIGVVGHRVVHGGTEFRDSVRINDRVKEVIAGLSSLAPLHNPPALRAIEAAEAAFPGLPQVAVFDTAFYAHLEPRAYLYPLPYEFYEKWGIRRYGFHGLSHGYCAARAAELLNRPLAELNVIVCHLGGGCSATAVRGGRAVAMTTGFSPLDGLMMGTRPGALDPGILLALQEQHGLTVKEIGRALNSASGLLGISGISQDLGALESAAQAGHVRARLACEMFADRVRTAIGGLAVTLGSVEGLVFTDRMGENSPAMRAAVCEGLEILGLRLDHRINESARPDQDVAAADSQGRILVIHAREELMVAREAVRVVQLDDSEVKPPGRRG